MITAGVDCADCIYYEDKGNKVGCTARDKTYYYGQKLPCEDKEKNESKN